jgi:hypothetical protein
MPRCFWLQRSKNRRSAVSSSSEKTTSSWRHLPRDSVQRRRLEASKAHQHRDDHIGQEDRAAANAEAMQPCIECSQEITQPISASQSLFQSSQNGPRTIAQK